jgi:uncharacterized membrane protein YgcG
MGHKKRVKVLRLKPVCTGSLTCTQTYAKKDDSSTDVWLYYSVVYSPDTTPSTSIPATANWTRSERAPSEDEIEQEFVGQTEPNTEELGVDDTADVDSSDMDSDSSSDMDSSSDSSSDSSADSSFDGGGDAGGGDGGGGE